MKAILFVALTIAASWLLVGLYFVCGGTWTMPGALILSVLYMFVPMTIAIIVQKLLLDRFETGLTQEQIEQMRAQVAATPVHPFWLGLIQGLIAGITINALAAFGEELGWRGLLQKELAWMGFWRSSLLIGMI